MRLKHLVTILVLLALAVPASPAHAGGIVSVCDEAHLRVALAGGGTVTFSCSGIITLTAEITIAADTTIDGSGQTVTISGNQAVRVFRVNLGVEFNLRNITIANGNSTSSGGGIYNDGGSITVSNSTFSTNSTNAYGGGGGGIANSNGGTLTVSNSTFYENNAGSTAGGGAIFNGHNGGGTLTVSHSTFSGNIASYGGSFYNVGILTVSNSTFLSNCATGAGGGIYNTSTVIVTNSTFSDNSAGQGGAISGGGTMTVSNSTFSGNSASGVGGGVGNYGMLEVSNSTFFDNSASRGGGINTNSGTVTVRNSTFFDNSAADWGGGINNLSPLTVTNSTFSGNSARGGGGIENDSTTTVSNSTFSNNSAVIGGGGIRNTWMSRLTVSNSTLSGNSAGSGGGIGNSGGVVALQNMIVANSPTGGNCYGTITDGGGNLSYPDATCPGINGDPKLGPLQNNLGPTETMQLGSGSAAIDAGNDAICAAAPVNNRDQRGIARPQGPHCDIGAVEQVPLKGIWLPTVRSR